MKWSRVSNATQGLNEMKTKRHLVKLVTKNVWTLEREVSVTCG